MTDENKPADEAATEETPDTVVVTDADIAPADDLLTDPPVDPVPADDQAIAGEDDIPADDDPEAEPEFVSEKTGKPLAGAALAGAKKKADKIRREAAIAEAAENTAEVPEEVTLEDERRAGIADQLVEIDEEVTELDARASELRTAQQALMLELYPQQGENDLHSTAVKGYLKASARERQHRALAPQRMKAMLKQMGLSPIDAAMQRKKARGMGRPNRKLAKQAAAPGQGDQALDAKPDKTAIEQTE